MIERDARGVPYLAPHGSLLYKAEEEREKDDADLGMCLPYMSTEARGWLRSVLEHAPPDHTWIARLT